LGVNKQVPDRRFVFGLAIINPPERYPRPAETMASLNLSTNGPSIKSSYQGVINGPAVSSTSATAARWALFTVQAPLLNAFQNTGAKESVLKVESTGGKCDDHEPPIPGGSPDPDNGPMPA
jgi:hypothetical protein